MSNALALTAATTLLKHLLENGLVEREITASVGGDAQVSLVPPDRIQSGTDERPRLNLFLYRVETRGTNSVSRFAPDGPAVPGSPPTLELSYLLSAYGAQDYRPRRCWEPHSTFSTAPPCSAAMRFGRSSPPPPIRREGNSFIPPSKHCPAPASPTASSRCASAPTSSAEKRCRTSGPVFRRPFAQQLPIVSPSAWPPTTRRRARHERDRKPDAVA